MRHSADRVRRLFLVSLLLTFTVSALGQKQPKTPTRAIGPDPQKASLPVRSIESLLPRMATLPTDGPKPRDAKVVQAAAAASKEGYWRPAIVRTEHRSIIASYTLRATYPRLFAKEFVLYAPEPPTLPGQKIHRAWMVPRAEAVADWSDDARPLLLLRLPVAKPYFDQTLEAALHINAQLYARRLVLQRQEDPPADPRPGLRGAPRERYLQATGVFDIDDPAFTSWVAAAGLSRETGEPPLQFAYRVFQYLRAHGGLRLQAPAPAKASDVIHARLQSNALGLAMLYVGVMRHGKTPARLLVGKWARSATERKALIRETGSIRHAQAEVFVDQLGWMPVDLAMALVADPAPEGLRFFGSDSGDFLCLHLDGELILETFVEGRRSLPTLEGILAWFRATGTTDGARVHEDWSVAEVSGLRARSH